MDSDRELVERVLASDRAAFRELIDLHRRLVAHVVFKAVRDEHDREEVCQDVFVRVFRKLDSFRFESSLSTWIARIAYTTALNHLEKRRLILYADLRPPEEESQGDPIDEVAEEAADALERVEADELKAFVRQEVDRLPLVYRTVVTMYHLEEMSVREIATVVGRPEGTVKNDLFRARRLLKQRMMAAFAHAEVS